MLLWQNFHQNDGTEKDMESRQSVKGVTSMVPMNGLDKAGALDLKVYSCNPAKWIVDVVWLNLVEWSKFP